MLEIIETPIEYKSELKDCRSLNRMEMIGFISCDIMSRKWDDDILNAFIYIFLHKALGRFNVIQKIILFLILLK